MVRGTSFGRLVSRLNRAEAKGSRCRVYKAEDSDFGERFKRESQLAASIKHPNVVSIYRSR
jgi:serine/threonine protein kinase